MNDKKSIKISVNDHDDSSVSDDSIAGESHKKIPINNYTESEDNLAEETSTEQADVENIETEDATADAEDVTTEENSEDDSGADSEQDAASESEESAENLEEAEAEAEEEVEESDDQVQQDSSELQNQEESPDSESENVDSEISEIPETDKTVGDAIDETKSESDVFESDPDIDAAVDDIVRTESDEAIAETDAKLAALSVKKEKKSLGQKIKGGFRAWWDNRPARYGVLAALIVLFGVIILLPATRYAVLNFFGVRVSSSMTVLDSQTQLPLKNITVQLQDKTATTNEEGEVVITELKLGNSQLSITKRGYADNMREIVLGWGSNPIGEQSLVATGEQFTFVLRDWKSEKPITNAEATSGENSAKADDSGKIIITTGEENVSDVEISITAEGYRTEKYSSDSLTDEETKVMMVPSKKHAFVSNRNGEYDLYTIDIDGKNEKILMAATGKEREVPLVVPHHTKDVIAYVSSRDGEQNNGGFIVDGLYIVDAVNGDNERIARSEQLQIIGWSGDNVVFLQIIEGTSQGSSERSKLISYNYVTKERTDLAASNYFNDVELVGSKLYYGISSYAVPESQAKLFVIDVDGKNKEKVVDNQVWNIFRTSHDTLLFSAVDQKWFKKVVGTPVEELPQQPAPVALNFVDSPDGKQTVWVEVRDGKGVLLKSAISDIKEEQIMSLPGLTAVLYWADNSTVVFRVISTDETADYVLNLDGGEMQKITDVTATRNSYF